MIDLSSIQVVVLDIAPAKNTQASQEEISDFILTLLGRNYQIRLFSSNPEYAVKEESFQHPGLSYWDLSTPPTRDQLEGTRGVLDKNNLWVTDNGAFQDWLSDLELFFATRESLPDGLENGLRYGALRDLSDFLNPTRETLGHLAGMILGLREKQPRKPVIVAIGGAPTSETGDFALRLKERLEEQGVDLVEDLDLHFAVRDVEERMVDKGAQQVDREGLAWVVETLLKPAARGETVLVDKYPAWAAERNPPHPLYVLPESVLILYGEMVLDRRLRPFSDLTILVEVNEQNVVKRMFEMEVSGELEEKFIRQYRERQGAVYQAYLTENQVDEWVDIHIDGSIRGVYTVKPAPFRLS